MRQVYQCMKRLMFVVLNLLVAMVLVITISFIQGAEADHSSSSSNEFNFYMYYNSVLEKDVVIIENYTGPDVQELTVPSEIDGCPVVSIRDLGVIPSLKRLILPETLTDIPDVILRVVSDALVIEPAQALIRWPHAVIKGTGSEGDFKYDISLVGGVVVTRYTGNAHEVVIPDTLGGLPVVGLGGSLFYRNGTIKSVLLPDTITSLASSCFFGCSSLESIRLPNGVTQIPYSAFWYCDALREIMFSDRLTEIGGNAFRGCESLVKIDLPQTLASIGDSAFDGCRGLKAIKLPDGLGELGAYAFCDCDALRKITLPDNLKSIGQGAFYECDHLASAVLPDGLEHIGDSIFSACSALTDVTLPTDITHVPDSMFRSCDSLKTVKLPKSVTSIGAEAFMACDLRAVSLRDAVTDIGIGAYAYNKELSKVTLPKGMTAIPDNLFSGCDALSEITLPNGALSIGSRAFEDCALQSVKLPKGLLSIGAEAFRGCSRLRTLTLPDSLRVIGAQAFTGTPWLRKQKTVDNWITLGDNLYHIFVGPGNIVVPAEYASFAVMYDRLGRDERLFADDKYGIQAYVSEGIESIPNEAFASTKELVAVSLPESLRSIGDKAFYFCGNLREAPLPEGLTEIGDSAFFQCAYDISGPGAYVGLTSVTMPDSIQRVGRYAYAYCYALKELYVSSNLKEIPDGCFMDCINLENVAFSEGLESIKQGAFYGCKSLCTLSLPKSLNCVEGIAFEGCSALESVTLSRNTQIDDTAFPSGVRFEYYEQEESSNQSQNSNTVSPEETYSVGGRYDAQGNLVRTEVTYRYKYDEVGAVISKETESVETIYDVQGKIKERCIWLTINDKSITMSRYDENDTLREYSESVWVPSETEEGVFYRQETLCRIYDENGQLIEEIDEHALTDDDNTETEDNDIYITPLDDDELLSALSVVNDKGQIFIDVKCGLTLLNNVTTNEHANLRVLNGGCLTVPEGVTFTLQGVMRLWNGEVVIKGTLCNHGHIEVGERDSPGPLIIYGGYEDNAGYGSLALYSGTLEGAGPNCDVQ